MEYWQFLIQKAGDHSWLPLDTPSGEILEGRYQVVAHSSRRNVEVNIQISYQFTEQGIPKRHVQERSHHTNSEGLVLVLPFTDLRPGLWYLACSGSTASDPATHVWHEFIQLQVLPCAAEIDADWDWIDPPAYPQAELQTRAAENSSGLQDETIESTSEPTLASVAGLKRPPSLHLPAFDKQGQPLKFVVSAGQVFPPRLRPNTETCESKAPELPVISRPAAKFVPCRAVAQPQVATSNYQNSRTRSSAQTLAANTNFEGLNLRGRFWSTLNALAQEPLVQPELAASSHDSATASQAITPPSEGRQRDASLSQDDQRASSGVALPYPKTQNQKKVNLRGLLLEPNHALLKSALIIQGFTEVDRSPETTTTVFSDDEIVPTPRLIVPEGALTAGQPLTICVRIPDHVFTVYVKLWVNDRKTYSLVDGPRWLVDFTQHQQGLLEARTQLIMPLNSQEISFEAIAIEVQTQRESHKVTVERSVIPPGDYW